MPSVLLWLLGLTVQPATSFFQLWPAPQRQLAIAIMVVIWAAMLFWIFVRDGVETLLRIRGVKSSVLNRWSVKLVVLAGVAVGATSLFNIK
jgi:hypothetical protein